MGQKFFIGYMIERKNGTLIPDRCVTDDPRLIPHGNHGIQEIEAELLKQHQGKRFNKKVTVTCITPWKEE